MKEKLKHLFLELKIHLPLTIFSVAIGIVVLGILTYISIILKAKNTSQASYALYHIFHPLHMLFSSIATTAMFWRHEKRLLKAIIIGFIGAVGICGVSDILIPFYSGRLLGVKMHWHICIIEHPQIILPFVAVGILTGFIVPREIQSTIFSHSAHVMISSMASILYLISFGLSEWIQVIGMVFIYMILAVIIPCCTSDIVFPLLLTEREFNYKRQINYLRVSITDRCNLRCIYCMPQEGIFRLRREDVLTYEEIIRVVKVAIGMGIKKVRVTGGEPLLRKGVVEFIKSLSLLPQLSDISMTTNGILLEEFAQDLYEAGLDRINVSLDSLSPEGYRKITGKDLFDKVLRGINKAEKMGLSPVKINVVVIRGLNDDEILDFVRLTFTNPYQVRFIELMPLGSQDESNKREYVSGAEIRQKIESFYSLHPIDTRRERGPAAIYKFERAKGEIGFISPLSNHFCSTCNRLRLTCDGKLRTCLFFDEEVDLKIPLREGCDDEELKRIIASAILKKPERHNITESVFRKCIRPMSMIGG